MGRLFHLIDIILGLNLKMINDVNFITQIREKGKSWNSAGVKLNNPAKRLQNFNFWRFLKFEFQDFRKNIHFFAFSFKRAIRSRGTFFSFFLSLVFDMKSLASLLFAPDLSTRVVLRF